MANNDSLTILSLEGNASYKFHEQALEKLLSENVDLRNRLIVPISIAGAMRTGKSFLLNVMLLYLNKTYNQHNLMASPENEHHSETFSMSFIKNKFKKVVNWFGDKLEKITGFTMAPGTIKRCTEGISIWKNIFLYDSPTGEKLAIVLIDTQGVYDQYSTPRDNNVIFATSTLISSVQINNVMQNINEEDLKNLKQFADFGKAARENIVGPAFQKLVFLVRDSTGVKKSFGYEGGSIFLEERFKCNLPELNQTRQEIREAFSSITCFLMPRPGYEEFEEEDYDGNIGALRPIAREQFQSFVESILAPENLVIKTINGEKMTMQSFIIFTRNYVKFFNTEGTIKKTNYVAATSLSVCETSVKRRFESYLTSMTGVIERIDNIASLDIEHNSLKAVEMKQFELETQFVDQESSKTFSKLLENKIDELYTNSIRKRAEIVWAKGFVPKDKSFNPPGVAAASILNGITEDFKKVGDTVVTILEKIDDVVTSVSSAIGSAAKSIWNFFT